MQVCVRVCIFAHTRHTSDYTLMSRTLWWDDTNDGYKKKKNTCTHTRTIWNDMSKMITYNQRTREQTGNHSAAQNMYQNMNYWNVKACHALSNSHTYTHTFSFFWIHISTISFGQHFWSHLCNRRSSPVHDWNENRVVIWRECKHLRNVSPMHTKMFAIYYFILTTCQMQKIHNKRMKYKRTVFSSRIQN